MFNFAFLLLRLVQRPKSSIYDLKLHRSLWSKENGLTSEIDKLKAEVEKAEKSLDHAIPGVSNPFFRTSFSILFEL